MMSSEVVHTAEIPSERMEPPKGIQTLADLIRMLHFLKCEGCDQRTIIEWLHAFTSRLGIRMCHDEHKSPAPAPTPKVAPEEPGAREPKPPAEEPKPAAEEPKPAAEEPKPAAKEPKPAAEEPKPAAEEPKTAAGDPKPPAEKVTTEEPKPPAEEPKPAAEKVATEEPAAEEPKPAAEEPKPAPEEPTPAEMATLEVSLAGAARSGLRLGRAARRGTKSIYDPVEVTIHRGHLYIGTSPPQPEGVRILPPLPPYREGTIDTVSDGPNDSDRFAFLDSGRVAIWRIQLSGGRDRDAPRHLQNIPLVSECNGVVIDAIKWSLLAVPPRAFNLRAPSRDVNTFLAEGLYDIICPADGTVVTLYAWESPGRLDSNPVWCMATSNGYDVSALKWIGDKTYAEVFFSVASKYDIAGVELRVDEGGKIRIFFEQLDPTRSYTVGFRHHNFHPLRHDPERMWQIQWVELDPRSEVAPKIHFGEGGIPRVPHQTVRDRDALAEQLPHDLTVEGLRHLSRSAFDDAKTLISGPAPAPENSFHYGHILRSRDPERTKSCSDILIESPLLTYIRTKVYQQPRSRLTREDLDHDSRLEYNVLRAYLTMSDRADFPLLFPQYADAFLRYEGFIKSVKDSTIRMFRQKAFSTRMPKSQTPTMKVAGAMHAHIERYEPEFNAFHKNTPAIIHDYIVRPEYTLLFLAAIRAGRTTKKPAE